jgi:DNA repair protein RecO
MHRVFVTDGIMLGKRPLGEAHTLVSVLTENLGLVRAKATSTRVESSKLRYGTEPFTLGRFSFVQGKYEWKLTGVENISRELLSPYPRNRIAGGRIAKLLLRLIRGEEEGRALFSTVQEGLALLSRAESAEVAASIECVLVLRVLSHLGYLPHTPALAPFVEGEFASAELTMSAQASRAFLIRTINESLLQTGL